MCSHLSCSCTQTGFSGQNSSSAHTVTTGNDQRIAQGRDNARQYLKEHPEVADEIDALLRQQMNQLAVPALDDGDIPEMDPEMEDGGEE